MKKFWLVNLIIITLLSFIFLHIDYTQNIYHSSSVRLTVIFIICFSFFQLIGSLIYGIINIKRHTLPTAILAIFTLLFMLIANLFMGTTFFMP